VLSRVREDLGAGGAAGRVTVNCFAYDDRRPLHRLQRAHAAALMDFRQAMAKAGVGEIRIKTEFRAEEANSD